MAGEAVGEFAEHLSFMGLAMTIRAGRQMPMTGMTKITADLTMSAGCSSPEIINTLMARRAGRNFFLASQIDLQRRMCRMTLQACALLLIWQVGLVTLGAGGDSTMLLAVATATGLFAVRARFLAQSAVHLLMTIPAEGVQHLH
jgi:hypothetical protein